MNVANIHFIKARDLPDLWFQAVHDILDKGRKRIVDRGSYVGQTRLEFDKFIGEVSYPGTKPLIPDIPQSIGIPNPVEEAYIFGGSGYKHSYLEYLMTPIKEPGEAYTYGERLTMVPLETVLGQFRGNKEIIDLSRLDKTDGKIVFEKEGKLYLNQIEWTIDTYKRFGSGNNQMVLQVAQPSDMALMDPPCLRHIDTRINEGKLIFHVSFRSWDLWGGLPANLAGIQMLKEYMAGEIGVDDGPMIVDSKGLHLYGYAEDLAKMRCMRVQDDWNN